MPVRKITINTEPFKPTMNEFETKVTKITTDLADRLIAKNHDYGNAFHELIEDFGNVVMALHSHDMVRALQSVGRYAPPEILIPFSRLTTDEKNQVIYEVLKNECEK